MRASILFALGLVMMGSNAFAAERCERQALVAAVAKLPGSAKLRVVKGSDKTTLIETATKQVVLEATCDGVKVPLAEGLPRDQKGAGVYKDERFTVAVTNRGAVSLGIAAGLAAMDAIELVTFDDDSLSLTDGRGRVWYSLSTRADGTLVEVEGGHNGCGCERTTSPSGQQVTRRL